MRSSSRGTKPVVQALRIPLSSQALATTAARVWKGSLGAAAALSGLAAWEVAFPASGVAGVSIDPHPASRVAQTRTTGTRGFMSLRRRVGGIVSVRLSQIRGRAAQESPDTPRANTRRPASRQVGWRGQHRLAAQSVHDHSAANRRLHLHLDPAGHSMKLQPAVSDVTDPAMMTSSEVSWTSPRGSLSQAPIPKLRLPPFLGTLPVALTRPSRPADALPRSGGGGRISPTEPRRP